MPDTLRSLNPIFLLYYFGGIVILLGLIELRSRPARRKRHVAWSVRNTTLLRDGHALTAGIRISTEYEHARTLSVARLAIWNPLQYGATAGTKGIDCTIVGATAGIQILDASVLEENLEDGEISLKSSFNRRQVGVQMPPLPGQRGAVLQIVHTGAEANDLRIDAGETSIPLTFYPPGSVYLNTKRPPKIRIRNTLPRMAAIILVMALLVLLLFVPLAERFPATKRLLDVWDFAASFVVYASVVTHVRARRKGEGKRVPLPLELDSFFGQ